MMLDEAEHETDPAVGQAIASKRGRQASALLAVWACVVGVIAGLVFTVFPQIDLWAAGLFRLEDGSFAFQRGVGRVARTIFMWGFIAVVVVALIGLGRAIWRDLPTLWVTGRAWGFLLVCFIVGPLIVTNVVLKDNWGRARPKQVEALGGTKTFTPALQPTDQCERNCSFVSGEASSIFMLFFALALVFTSRARGLMIAGAVIGLVAGIIRMGAGGHFLSDVIFAGVFMALTASAVFAAYRYRESHESED